MHPPGLLLAGLEGHGHGRFGAAGVGGPVEQDHQARRRHEGVLEQGGAPEALAHPLGPAHGEGRRQRAVVEDRQLLAVVLGLELGHHEDPCCRGASHRRARRGTWAPGPPSASPGRPCQRRRAARLVQEGPRGLPPRPHPQTAAEAARSPTRTAKILFTALREMGLQRGQGPFPMIGALGGLEAASPPARFSARGPGARRERAAAGPSMALVGQKSLGAAWAR